MEQQILDELRAIRQLLERIEENTRNPFQHTTTIKAPKFELYPRWFETVTAAPNPYPSINAGINHITDIS